LVFLDIKKIITEIYFGNKYLCPQDEFL